jgi:DNA gyrase subunit A
VKKTDLADFAPRSARPARHRSARGEYVLIGTPITDGEQDVMLFSSAGKAVRFNESDVRSMGRAAAVCAASPWKAASA